MRLTCYTDIGPVCMGKDYGKGGRDCHLGKYIDERGKSNIIIANSSEIFAVQPGP